MRGAGPITVINIFGGDLFIYKFLSAGRLRFRKARELLVGGYGNTFF